MKNNIMDAYMDDKKRIRKFLENLSEDDKKRIRENAKKNKERIIECLESIAENNEQLKESFKTLGEDMRNEFEAINKAAESKFIAEHTEILYKKYGPEFFEYDCPLDEALIIADKDNGSKERVELIFNNNFNVLTELKENNDSKYEEAYSVFLRDLIKFDNEYEDGIITENYKEMLTKLRNLDSKLFDSLVKSSLKVVMNQRKNLFKINNKFYAMNVPNDFKITISIKELFLTIGGIIASIAAKVALKAVVANPVVGTAVGTAGIVTTVVVFAKRIFDKLTFKSIRNKIRNLFS